MVADAINSDQNAERGFMGIRASLRSLRDKAVVAFNDWTWGKKKHLETSPRKMKGNEADPVPTSEDMDLADALVEEFGVEGVDDITEDELLSAAAVLAEGVENADLDAADVFSEGVSEAACDDGEILTQEERDALRMLHSPEDFDVPYFARKGPLAFFKEDADFQKARGILDKLAQEQPDLNLAQAYLTDDYKALSFPGDAADHPIDLQGLPGRIFEKFMFAVQETLEVLRAGKSVGGRDPYEGLSAEEIASVEGEPVTDETLDRDVFEGAPSAVIVHSSAHNLVEDVNKDKVGERSSSQSNYEVRKQWAQMLRGYATSDPVGVEPSDTLKGEARHSAENGENHVMQDLEAKGHLYEHFSFAEDQGDDVVVHNRLTGEQHKVELKGNFNAADVAEVLNNKIHADHYRRRDAGKPNFEMV